jgi:hypothetical protein
MQKMLVLIHIIIPCLEMLGTGLRIILKKAIKSFWELLTEVYKILKKTYVLVLKEMKRMFFFDQESWDIWKELISEDRIHFRKQKSKFWEKWEIKVRAVHVLKNLDFTNLKKKKKL